MNCDAEQTKQNRKTMAQKFKTSYSGFRNNSNVTLPFIKTQEPKLKIAKKNSSLSKKINIFLKKTQQLFEKTQFSATTVLFCCQKIAEFPSLA